MIISACVVQWNERRKLQLPFNYVELSEKNNNGRQYVVGSRHRRRRRLVLLCFGFQGGKRGTPDPMAFVISPTTQGIWMRCSTGIQPW